MKNKKYPRRIVIVSEFNHVDKLFFQYFFKLKSTVT